MVAAVVGLWLLMLQVDRMLLCANIYQIKSWDFLDRATKKVELSACRGVEWLYDKVECGVVMSSIKKSWRAEFCRQTENLPRKAVGG